MHFGVQRRCRCNGLLEGFLEYNNDVITDAKSPILHSKKVICRSNLLVAIFILIITAESVFLQHLNLFPLRSKPNRPEGTHTVLRLSKNPYLSYEALA